MSDFFNCTKFIKQMNLNTSHDYDLLINQIGQIYSDAQKAAHQAISTEFLKAYYKKSSRIPLSIRLLFNYSKAQS